MNTNQFSILQAILAISTLSLSSMSVADPVTNKCTDGWRITYANMPCEKLGLQQAGPIRNLVTVMPAFENPEDQDRKSISDAAGTVTTVEASEHPGTDPEKNPE